MSFGVPLMRVLRTLSLLSSEVCRKVHILLVDTAAWSERVVELWRSGGRVVEKWWKSGGRVVEEWWKSGGGVVVK